MVADPRIGLVVGLLVLTMPIAGCLSATQQPGGDDVASLHVHHRFDDGEKVAYDIEPSSPAGVGLVGLSLEALSQAEGPFDASSEDPPPHLAVNLTVGLAFEESHMIQDLGQARGLQLAVTNETPNLLLEDAGGDHGPFHHAPVDVAPLEEAAESALDQIRAENGGELPRSNVTVERPSDDTSRNETSENGTSDGE